MNNNKHIAFSILVSAAILLVSCGGRKPNYKVSLKTDADSASYYLGYSIGTNFPQMDFEDVNINAFAKGLQEAVKQGKEVDQVKIQELQMFLNDFFMNLQNRTSEKALKEGQDFLEANKKKQGVVTLPSGVQYKIIREGTGNKPTMDDDADLLYHGTLIDGTVFDSSKERGDTVNFPVSGVVPGFSEALTLMTEGSIWEVYIPAELAYGERSPDPQRMKPNSVLIFEIDMIKVIKQTFE